MQNNKSTPVFKIGNHLIEAYKGYYEDEVLGGTEPNEAYEEWANLKILSHTPQERLAIYCEWNGILGYDRTLYDIATGKL